ncbi:hypothetical protein [Novibacillus thermophilus]|nr:hypothetical protein [Novibacillus thermophilus]
MSTQTAQSTVILENFIQTQVTNAPHPSAGLSVDIDFKPFF